MSDYIESALASLRSASRNLEAMRRNGVTGTQKMITLQQLANASTAARMIPTPHTIKPSPLPAPDMARVRREPVTDVAGTLLGKALLQS